MTEQGAKAHRRSINQSGAEMNVITVPDGTNRICERASFAEQRRKHTRLRGSYSGRLHLTIHENLRQSFYLNTLYLGERVTLNS